MALNLIIIIIFCIATTIEVVANEQEHSSKDPSSCESSMNAEYADAGALLDQLYRNYYSFSSGRADVYRRKYVSWNDADLSTDDILNSFWLKLSEMVRKPKNAQTIATLLEDDSKIKPYLNGIMEKTLFGMLKSARRYRRATAISSIGEFESIDDLSKPKSVSENDEISESFSELMEVLPAEQAELFQLPKSEQDPLSLIMQKQKISLRRAQERVDFLERNLRVLTTKFKSADRKKSRAENPNRLRINTIYVESRFYELLAALGRRNRLILGLSLVEGLSSQQILDHGIGYTNLLSVEKQKFRAFKSLKSLLGIEDPNFRMDTVVVLLQEQDKLAAPRRFFYAEPTPLQVEKAKSYATFKFGSEFSESVYEELLSLINPIQAEVLDLRYRRRYSDADIAEYLNFESIQWVAKIADLALHELVVLTKNRYLARQFNAAAKSLFGVTDTSESG